MMLLLDSAQFSGDLHPCVSFYDSGNHQQAKVLRVLRALSISSAVAAAFKDND
jgi:hypothetical protein